MMSNEISWRPIVILLPFMFARARDSVDGSIPVASIVTPSDCTRICVRAACGSFVSFPCACDEYDVGFLPFAATFWQQPRGKEEYRETA